MPSKKTKQGKGTEINFFAVIDEITAGNFRFACDGDGQIAVYSNKKGANDWRKLMIGKGGKIVRVKIIR